MISKLDISQGHFSFFSFCKITVFQFNHHRLVAYTPECGILSWAHTKFYPPHPASLKTRVCFIEMTTLWTFMIHRAGYAQDGRHLVHLYASYSLLNCELSNAGSEMGLARQGCPPGQPSLLSNLQGKDSQLLWIFVTPSVNSCGGCQL